MDFPMLLSIAMHWNNKRAGPAGHRSITKPLKCHNTVLLAHVNSNFHAKTLFPRLHSHYIIYVVSLHSVSFANVESYCFRIKNNQSLTTVNFPYYFKNNSLVGSPIALVASKSRCAHTRLLFTLMSL